MKPCSRISGRPDPVSRYASCTPSWPGNWRTSIVCPILDEWPPRAPSAAATPPGRNQNVSAATTTVGVAGHRGGCFKTADSTWPCEPFRYAPASAQAALRAERSAARLLTVVRRLSTSFRLVILALAGQALGRQQAGTVRRLLVPGPARPAARLGQRDHAPSTAPG